jgi:LysR family hydrogen peroxide-inducible transcriptional activator
MDGALRELVNSDKVEVRVGMSPFYSKHYLPEILRIINSQLPNISLSMVESISEEQEDMLKSGELDFCCIPQDPEVPGLSYEPICMEEILLAVPPASPLNNYAIPATPIPFLDSKYINGQKMVTLKPVQKINKLLTPLMESLNLKCPVAYETLDWDMVDLMVGNGVGIGFVPDILYSQKHDNQSPNYYRTMNKGFLRCYSIAYKSGKTFTDIQRHLISIFKSSIQNLRKRNITL